MRTVYVSIGNSDDKLTQQRWHSYCVDVGLTITRYSKQFHGIWFSESSSPWQNACWCIEPWPHMVEQFKQSLSILAEKYQQDSIAWAEAETTFLTSRN